MSLPVVYNPQKANIWSLFDKGGLLPIEPATTPASPAFWTGVSPNPCFPAAFKSTVLQGTPGNADIGTISLELITWASLTSAATSNATRMTAVATALNTWDATTARTAAFANAKFSTPTDAANCITTLFNILLNVNFATLPNALQYITFNLGVLSRSYGDLVFNSLITTLTGLAAPIASAPVLAALQSTMDAVLQHKIPTDAAKIAATATAALKPSIEPTFIAGVFATTGTNAVQMRQIFGTALIHAMYDGVTFQQYIANSLGRFANAPAFSSDQSVLAYLATAPAYYPTSQTAAPPAANAVGPTLAHETRFNLIMQNSGLTPLQIATAIMLTPPLTNRIPLRADLQPYEYAMTSATVMSQSMQGPDFTHWASNAEMQQIQARDFFRAFAAIQTDADCITVLEAIQTQDNTYLATKTNLTGVDDASTPPLYYGLTTATSAVTAAQTALTTAQTQLATDLAASPQVPATISTDQAAVATAQANLNIAQAHAEMVGENYNMACINALARKWNYLVGTNFNFAILNTFNSSILTQAIKHIFRLQIITSNGANTALLTALTNTGAGSSNFPALITKMIAQSLQICNSAYTSIQADPDASSIDATRSSALQRLLNPTGGVTIPPSNPVFIPTSANYLGYITTQTLTLGVPVLTAYNNLFMVITGNNTSTGLTLTSQTVLRQALASMLNVPNNGTTVTTAAKEAILANLIAAQYITVTDLSSPDLSLQSSFIPFNGVLGTLWLNYIDSAGTTASQLLDSFGRTGNAWAVLQQVAATFNGNDALSIAKAAALAPPAPATAAAATKVVPFAFPSNSYITSIFNAYFSTATLTAYQTTGLALADDLLLKTAVLFPAQTIAAAYTYLINMPATNSLTNSVSAKTALTRFTTLFNVAVGAWLVNGINAVKASFTTSTLTGAALTAAIATALNTFAGTVAASLIPAPLTGTGVVNPPSSVTLPIKVMIGNAVWAFILADAVANAATTYVSTTMSTAIQTSFGAGGTIGQNAITTASMAAVAGIYSTSALLDMYWETNIALGQRVSV